MAPRRHELQDLLIETLGTKNVYFQPPPTVQMQYPCIVYERDFNYTAFADDQPYRHKKRYLVTVIDRDPDSVIPDKIAKLPMCVFDRFFTADNLNHDVYRIFF
jgi:hypothetical protein